MIKVTLPFEDKYLSGENVWVKPLGGDTGEINNLPVFATKYRYKDIIRFDPNTWDFIEKVADGGFTRTKVHEYTGKFSEEKAYWESKGYVVESFAPGVLGVSRRRSKKLVRGDDKIDTRQHCPLPIISE